LTDVKVVNRLKRLHQTQEMKSAVERADLAVGRDHGRGVSAQFERTDAESFRPEIGELTIPFEAGYQKRTLRRSDDHSAVALNLLRNGSRAAEQSRATVGEFAANGFERRRAAWRDNGSDARPVDLDHLLRKRIVAQPQAIAIFGRRSDLQRDCHYEKTYPKNYGSITFYELLKWRSSCRGAAFKPSPAFQSREARDSFPQSRSDG
jgi:hypothetical protein